MEGRKIMRHLTRGILGSLFAFFICATAIAQDVERKAVTVETARGVSFPAPYVGQPFGEMALEFYRRHGSAFPAYAEPGAFVDAFISMNPRLTSRNASVEAGVEYDLPLRHVDAVEQPTRTELVSTPVPIVPVEVAELSDMITLSVVNSEPHEVSTTMRAKDLRAPSSLNQVSTTQVGDFFTVTIGGLTQVAYRFFDAASLPAGCRQVREYQTNEGSYGKACFMPKNTWQLFGSERVPQ